MNEDYTNVFLFHVKLYIFVKKYDIQTLRTLTLENLYNVLTIFTLYKERIENIITTLRYVYANSRKLIDGIEDLRTLLKLYVRYEMDTLMEDEGFCDLMIEEGGTLLGDFMKMMMKKIH